MRKIYTKESFQGSGYVFQQLYWKIKTRLTLKKAFLSPPHPFGNVSKIHPFWWRHSSPKEPLRATKSKTPLQNGPFLEVEIMWMYFTLSDPFTYLYIQPYIVPPIFEGFVSIIKNLQHKFPKMRAGSKAILNFSKNLSVLVPWPAPKTQLIR